MTVKDLIEELKKLDETMQVYIPFDSFFEGLIEPMSFIDITVEDGKAVASIC